jgi:hypothetical protein
MQRLGEVKELDVNLIIPDDSLSITRKASLGKPRQTWFQPDSRGGKKYGFDFDLLSGRCQREPRSAAPWQRG